MISVSEAHESISRCVRKLPVETKPLELARGQFLAADIAADFPLPRFDNAAMDGFAVRWEDIEHASEQKPVTLQNIEEIPAGSFPCESITSGKCAQIMTGAPMPDGADTVVIFEHTSGFGGRTIDIFKAPPFRANVRYAGEEVRKGEVVLHRGTRLTPAETGVLATLGKATAPVYRRPKVGIVTVGDELRLPGEELDGGALYNSNRFALSSCVAGAGAEVTGLWQVPDDITLLREALADALLCSDMLLTAGGISTGEYDYLQQLLTRLGVQQEFWKVAQKPGKPFFFGTAYDKKMVFGLPGNPVSALVCFLEYGMPALFAMQGASCSNTLQAELVRPFSADKKRYRFLFGNIWQKDEKLFCEAAGKIESHMLTSLLGANCLIGAPAAPQPLPSGTAVRCAMLPWSSLYEQP